MIPQSLSNNPIDLNTFLAAIPGGVLILDQNGIVETFNPAALSILGVAELQLKSRTFIEQSWKVYRYDGTECSAKDHPVTLALSTGNTIRNSLIHIEHHDGTDRWVRLDVASFGSKAQSKTVCTFYDVTNLQKINSDLHRIFKHSRDLICIASTDGTFKRVSSSFSTILGFDEKDLINKPFVSFIHPEDIASTEQTVASLSGGAPLIDFENRYRTKSGDYRRISWSCDPVTSKGLLYAIGRDVTDIKSAEYKNQQILNAINQTAIVAFTDPKGIITEVNEKFCAVSGYSRDELLGKDHRLLNSGHHPKSFFKDMWDTIKSDQSWTSIIVNRKKSGEPYYLQSLVTPIKNTSGTIEQFLSIRFDVTEQNQTEQRLKEAQSISKIGSWHFDLHTGKQTWSDEHYKIFEIEPNQNQEILHKLYRERIHKDDLPGLDQVIEKALKLGEDFVFNHRVVLQNGDRIKFVQGIGKVTKNSTGVPMFISGTCQDVTEMRVQQERLKATLEFNEAIRRSAMLSIITTDLVGTITSFNEEAEKILGYTASEVIGLMTPAPFHDPAEVVAAAQELSNEYKTKVEVGFGTFIYKAQLGGFDERRWTYIRKDGTRIPVHLNVTGLYNSNNELYGFMGIAKDLSEQINLQNKLDAERIKSIRNAKLASLGEMSAGIAHEINNPLAIISGAVGLLSRISDNPEKLASKLETIKKSCDRIARIVNGLRKFSRSGERRDFQCNDLSTIVSEALILTEAKAKSKSTLLTSDCEGPKYIRCDEIEIEQVLVNLINNSIDAVQSLPERWIKVSIHEDSNCVVLRVTDSGPGIPEHLKNKLFDPFFTTKKVGEGTGLGLSIAKGILDEHNASIAVIEGVPNTCFEIRFSRIESIKNVS